MYSWVTTLSQSQTMTSYEQAVNAFAERCASGRYDFASIGDAAYKIAEQFNVTSSQVIKDAL
jgi:hypothetical protein